MDLTEKVARAMCADGGFSPDERMPNDGPRWKYYEHAARAAIAVCAEEIARLIDEGFDKPVGKPYRADGVPSKNDQCPHGAYMYENCEACCAAAIRSMGEKGE